MDTMSEKIVQRRFTPEEKLAILFMRKLGKIKKTVAAICDDVGIAPKTFYAWDAAYKTGGFDALKPNKRRVSNCLSRRPVIVQATLGLVEQHLDWGSAKITEALNNNGHRITDQTVRTILSREGLDNIEKRYGDLEQKIMLGELSPDEELLAQLFQHNPCFEDWHRMGHGPRHPIGSIMIPLMERKRPLGISVDILIDFDSLYAEGQICSPGSRPLLHRDVENRFHKQRHYQDCFFILGWDKSPELEFLDKWGVEHRTSDNDYCLPIVGRKKIDISFGANEVMRRKVLQYFTPLPKQDIDNVKATLTKWLQAHNNHPGSLGYPNFGKSPFETLKFSKRRKVGKL